MKTIFILYMVLNATGPVHGGYTNSVATIVSEHYTYETCMNAGRAIANDLYKKKRKVGVVTWQCAEK